MTNFDLLVVGGGSAGFAAAIRGAERGAQVGLVESGTLGGTCVNVGCVPSKTLLRAAEAAHRRQHHGFAGVPGRDGIPDWAAVRAQKDELVARLRTSKYVDVLESRHGVELIRGRAKLERGPVLRLDDGRILRAPRIIVATGASPWSPPIPGLAGSGFLDSATALALDALPASMIVIGAGSVGLELAQMFARLGVAVTVLETLPRIAAAEPAALGEALAGFLREEGIVIHTGATPRHVQYGSGYVVQFDVDGEVGEVRADQLLVAAGRRPNTGALGLVDAGIGLGARGEIIVDQYLRTSDPNVYAAGDVIGEPMYVYVAAHAGAIAAENALEGDVRRYELTALPRVTFTDPAIAAVGLTAAEAHAAGTEPIQSELPLEYVPRALAARDTRGFIRLTADAGSRCIIGAHILAAEAGEMIMEPALAIRHGLTIDDLAGAFHPYLTLSEGVRLAAQTFDRDVTTLSCCVS